MPEGAHCLTCEVFLPKSFTLNSIKPLTSRFQELQGIEGQAKLNSQVVIRSRTNSILQDSVRGKKGRGDEDDGDDDDGEEGLFSIKTLKKQKHFRNFGGILVQKNQLFKGHFGDILENLNMNWMGNDMGFSDFFRGGNLT